VEVSNEGIIFEEFCSKVLEKMGVKIFCGRGTLAKSPTCCAVVRTLYVALFVPWGTVKNAVGRKWISTSGFEL